MPPLVAGIDQSAAGAAEVAAGAGAADDGAASLQSGAQSLADGAAQVDSGAAQLAAGLAEAVAQIPVYTDDDISVLSSVASQPVRIDRVSAAPGLESVPFFAVIALWIGALVLALARPAVPRHPLLGSRPSPAITLEAVAPGAAIGAAQGGVVGLALLFAMQVEPLAWVGFVAGCAVAGLVFALVNQGLAAALSASGRFIAALAAVIALAAGLSSTVPPAVESAAALLPTAPALAMLLATLGVDGGGWMPFAALVAFGLAGTALVLAGVAGRRRVRMGDFAASP
jgi:putative membrane protein